MSNTSDRKNTLLICAYLFFLAIASSSCDPVVTDEVGKAKFAEMKEAFAQLPTYPGFRIVKNSSSMRAGHAVIGGYYHSSIEYTDVKTFYMEELAKQNWEFVSEEKMLDWGSNLGGRELVYHRGDIYFTLQYAGTNSSYGWDYAVGLDFGLPH